MAIVKIQHRRGNYADYDPSKVLPGEMVVTLANDPNASDGRAVYIGTVSGHVKQLATVEDMEAEVATALDEAVPAAVSDATTRAEAAAQSAAQSARTLTIDNTLTQHGQVPESYAAGQIVVVSDTQPSAVSNKMWLNPSSEEVEIPTMEDLESAEQSITNLQQDVVELEDSIDDVQTNLTTEITKADDNIANEFRISPNNTYPVGAYVIYEGILYVCNTETSARSWDPAKWTKVQIIPQFTTLRKDITGNYVEVSGTTTATVNFKMSFTHTYVFHNKGTGTITSVTAYSAGGGSIYTVAENLAPGGKVEIVHPTGYETVVVTFGSQSTLAMYDKDTMRGELENEIYSIDIDVDDTLTEEGKAADAKKTGDEVSAIKADLTELDYTVYSDFDIALESGSFDSNTGAKTANGARIRSTDFMKNVGGIITAKTKSGQQLSMLLYAWNGSTYIGFWGGSSFVKSGSQYLNEINLAEFIANYPGYTYKIVIQYSNASDVDAVQSNANSLQTIIEQTASEMENISDKIDNSNIISMESGTFDSSTGANKGDGARIRTKDFITNTDNSIITAHDSSGTTLGILLYAWDSSNNYIGFWGGVSFVKSGSQYLNAIDIDWFIQNYPTYKYKCVIATGSVSNTTVTQRSKKGLEYRVEVLEKNADILPDDISTSPDKNLCLCGIKTKIADDCLPYHEGYLFHSFKTAKGNKMWYGSNFHDMKLVGEFPIDPRQLRFAISPTDGRIIATNRDARDGIWVWTRESMVLLNAFTQNPQGWLYNSGVDFVIDDQNVEHCVFAEYNGNPTSSMVFNVWRGTYPYTSASDWEVVMTQTYSDITHFHMVKRDPWSNVLYLTSGDNSTKCKWWYSTDCGATWTLLTSGGTSGYEEHTCRLINFIFTKDYIYWATDKGTNHSLNRVSRDANGIIDVSSREKLCDLPSGYATNFLCYVETPNGLFMYDRVDTGYSSQYGDPVTMKFYDLTDSTLKDVVTLGLTEDTWGGSRGKCYVYVTNSKQTMPAMGFSPDTPCIFDLVGDISEIGSIAYEVGSKTVHTIDY